MNGDWRASSWVFFAALSNASGFILVAALACSPIVGKTIAKSAIDVALAACIAEQADVQDEPALREICYWTDELAPLVKELLAARTRGLAAFSKPAAASSCMTDAGRDSGDSGSDTGSSDAGSRYR